MNSFSGSYQPDDVTILLKRLHAHQFVAVREKETLIQSGARHYSEMLSPESLPSPRYLALFRQACIANRRQMARDCLVLARVIAARRTTGITLVSLARAGTPVGVILKHLLAKVFDRPAAHYSVSIIRDRGIDDVALQHILAQGHTPESIVFIDGWTGKGVISRELEKWISQFNQRFGTRIDGGLYVLSDLAGTAACASSADDYLIPSSILNATVSGLISRSILNDAIGASDFHGCYYYEQFAADDQSGSFVAEVLAEALALVGTEGLPDAAPLDRRRASIVSRRCMRQLGRRHGISDPNLIKPGIGEATRVLLRRVPYLLILREPGAPDVAHLKALAEEKQVPVVTDAALPYQAVSLIRSAADA